MHFKSSAIRLTAIQITFITFVYDDVGIHYT